MRKPALALLCSGVALAAPTTALAQNDGSAAASVAGCGICGSFFIFIFLGIVALNIAILVWVARDAKARGLDNAVLWMLLVFFTGFIGLIIYILARPQGPLIECPNCHNKRLQAAVRCPHCGS